MTVTREQFISRFNEMDRGENFSYEGRNVLFNYFEEIEEGTGEEIEFDVIAICCDFSELTEEEIKQDYDMTLEELRENTLVLDVEEEKTYIVQAF